MRKNGGLEHVASLDGLRTVAVGLVIAFHLSVPALDSGFAGVDIFFVLSGFLITSGLLADTEKHGRPRFALFWQRRFQRLMPAAALLLVTVLTYATFVMPVYRRSKTGDDAAWTTVYLANWHFMDVNSYFSSDGTNSPLLHMWSLAVEEQFYFIWPLVIGLVALLTRRRPTRLPLILVTGVAILASALALWLRYDPSAPDRAYMGTDTKAFEPLLGALLAAIVTVDRVREVVARRHRLVAAGCALLGLVVLPFLAGPSDFYFAGGALLLSLAVVGLIAALTCGAPTVLSRVLGWRPIAYLGAISYGLYLWHWPWAGWLGVAHGDFKPGPASVALAGTVVTAIASYHLVEQPIRRGRAARWFTPRRAVACVAVLMAALLGWSSWLRSSLGYVPEKSWMVVTGDSVPLRLMGSFDAVARDGGWAVESAASGGCTPLAAELQEYREPAHHGPGDCRGMRAIQDELIDRHHPEIVLWWSRYETHQRWYQGRLLRPEQEEFWTVLEAEVEASVDRLTRDGATLVIIQPERPGIGLLPQCPAGHTDCFPLDDYALNHDDLRRRWNQMVVNLAERDDRVATFRADDLFCNDPEPATAQAPSACDDRQPDGKLLRPDGIHVAIDPFGRRIAEEVLARAHQAAGR